MITGKKNRIKARFRAQWGMDPGESVTAYMTRDRIRYIRMYHENYGGQGIDGITWSDLEMDEVFFRINRTRSFVGEQVLFRQLHEPDCPERLEAFERMVTVFAQDEEHRTEYEYRLSRIGKTQADYYLPVMLQMIADHRGTDVRIYRCLQLLLLASVIGGVATQAMCCVTFAGIFACANLVIYLVTKSKQESMFSCLKTICVILNFCRFAEGDRRSGDEAALCRVREDLLKLRQVEHAAGSFTARKTAAVNDPVNLLMDYIWGITLVDLVIYEKIMQALSGNEDAVLRLFHYVGTCDAAISCASFRQSLHLWCAPQSGPDDTISFREMYHPLLKDAVPNDGTLAKTIIITGANASGKSTFMKGIAVNVILAQTIHTCAAREFAIPVMDIMSSVAIRDDILLGESYYVREVKYMKRMLQRLEEKRLVLFVIDEIMKGTDQKESLAVSLALLHYLRQKNCFVIAATHDRELVERLESGYVRYYFDCRYEDGQLRFDYLLRRGFGGETNAVRLLKLFDFPEEILLYADRILKEGVSYEDK